MKYLVNVSIADLRRDPVSAKFSYDRDLVQESQLLYNESVLGTREEGDWIYVEAVEQQRFDKENGWQGYPGWVLKNQLFAVNEFPIKNDIVVDSWTAIRREPFMDSGIVLQVCMGTRLHVLEKIGSWHILKLVDGTQGALHAGTPLEADVIKTAQRMTSHPYLWGGKSFFDPALKSQLSGCDCSGLVGLVYGVHGTQLPRDAHDQYLCCKPVEVADMKVGDLIFRADVEKPARKDHVMLFAGGDSFFDTNITDKKAVLTTAKERFGVSFADMKQDQIVGKYIVSFGSIDPEKLPRGIK